MSVHSMGDTFVLFHPVRPISLNGERNKSKWTRHKETDEWRQAFGWLVQQAAIPSYLWIEVDIRPYLPTRAGIQDPGNCMPSVKAAIDGVVDMGVIPDDGCAYVRRLTFLPTVVKPKTLGLEVALTCHERVPKWERLRKDMRGASRGRR